MDWMLTSNKPRKRSIDNTHLEPEAKRTKSDTVAKAQNVWQEKQSEKKWTKKDDLDLLNGIKRYKDQWEKISEESLKCKYDAETCQQRYKDFWQPKLENFDWTSLDREIVLRKEQNQTIFVFGSFEVISRHAHQWTPEEDLKLLNALRRIKEKRWKQIAEEYFANPNLPKKCFNRFKLFWEQQQKVKFEDIIQLEKEISYREEEGMLVFNFADKFEVKIEKRGHDWSIVNDERLINGILYYLKEDKPISWNTIAKDWLKRRFSLMSCYLRYINFWKSKTPWKDLLSYPVFKVMGNGAERQIQLVSSLQGNDSRMLKEEKIEKKLTEPDCPTRKVIRAGFYSSNFKELWSDKDDLALLQGLQIYGVSQCKIISETYLKNRHGYRACEERYRNFWQCRLSRHKCSTLEGEITMKKRAEDTLFCIGNIEISFQRPHYWNPEEDTKLLNGIRRYGTSWKDIVEKVFNGCVVNKNCSNRYGKLWKCHVLPEFLMGLKEEVTYRLEEHQLTLDFGKELSLIMQIRKK